MGGGGGVSGWRGLGAGVSEFFHYESKFKIKKKKHFFLGGRGARVNDSFLQRLQI